MTAVSVDGSRCDGCDRVVAVRARGPDRLCESCYDRSRAVECSACGRVRPPRRREAPDKPICSGCVRRHDAEAATAAMRETIVAVVALAEPDLDEASIASAVLRAAPNLRQTGWLADALADGPSVLFGGSVAPPVVDRLVVELQACGATRVRVPTCFSCGRDRWLTQRVDGLRACVSCACKARAEVCGRCGRHDRVATRDEDGKAVCAPCRSNDTTKFEDCSGCGRRARVARRTADGGAQCSRCGLGPPRVVACSVCGEIKPATSSGRRGALPKCRSCVRRRARCSMCSLDDRKVTVVWATGPVCSTCHKKALAAKGVCTGCGKRRRIDPRDPQRRGRCSDCAGLEPWSVCNACGAEDRIYDSGRCTACTLDHRLTEAIGTSVALAPLRDSLLGTDNPRSALRWISKPHTTTVLGGMARGELAVTHEALDDLPANRGLDHLRQVLVAAGVLVERDEPTARLEAWITAQLNGMTVAEDRKMVEAFARWWILRRYRWRMSQKGQSSAAHPRRLVKAAIDFLSWVRGHGLTLGECTQGHVELWMAGPPGRRQARHFLRWACQRGLANDLDILRRPDATPGRSINTDHHLNLARRLATDETLPVVDRVAGLLLLCYGQPLARLARLRTDDVTTNGDQTSVRFGLVDVDLSEPLSRLVTELAATRRGRATTGAADQTPWLFAGAQPGRPMSTERLRLRLAVYGIDARPARTSLLLDLAAELSPGFLADLLGMHPNTAVRWVRAANGDWSGYAAARATR